MYKYLLSWRYLRTRYIALASVLSVMLGVATLIIVNSVMAGFSEEMEQRMNGILSDVIIESHDIVGLRDPGLHEAEIRRILGDQVVGLTTTVHVPAMLTFKFRGSYQWRHITLIGIDDKSYASVSDFGKFLLHPENRRQVSFDLREDGYAPERMSLQPAGWVHRRLVAAYEAELEAARRQLERVQQSTESPHARRPTVPVDPLADAALPDDPYPAADDEGTVFDPAVKQHTGVILGISMASQRHRRPDTGEIEDIYFVRPGDDVEIGFPNCAQPPKVMRDLFTVVDFYESKMSEYDENFAFVPLSRLQFVRGMFDSMSEEKATVSAIQIKLQPGADLELARDLLRARFPIEHFGYSIRTWRDMQGPLLAAVQLETTILNILLFLIIAVAGFGILAIFFMIVVEKTRDIGVLKALGAPSRGVMGIFLNYGLSLGVVGSGVGMALGLLFVRHINEVADVMEWLTGREVFDPTVYYFQDIPVRVDPYTVAWVVAGALVIAVLASILPAVRAARLHPVEALRNE